MNYQKKFVATRTGIHGGIEQYLKTLDCVGIVDTDDYVRYQMIDHQDQKDKFITVDMYKAGHHLITLTVESNTDDLKHFIPRKHRKSNKKGLIDVTNHEYYESPESIMKYIKPFRVVIEGPKASGKSTAIYYLIKKGISAKDRDQEVFSNDCLLDLPVHERLQQCYMRINQDPNEYFVVLSCPEQELDNRLARRRHDSGTITRHSSLEYRDFYRTLNDPRLLQGKLFIVRPIIDEEENKKRFAPLMDVIRGIKTNYQPQKQKKRKTSR